MLSSEPDLLPSPASPALQRLPPELLASLSPAQREALLAALAQSPGSHSIDVRASIPILGRRFYITVLAGRERRSVQRLAREGQLDLGRVLTVYAALCALLAGPLLTILLVSAAISRVTGHPSMNPPALALQELIRRP